MNEDGNVTMITWLVRWLAMVRLVSGILRMGEFDRSFSVYNNLQLFATKIQRLKMEQNERNLNR